MSLNSHSLTYIDCSHFHTDWERFGVSFVNADRCLHITINLSLQQVSAVVDSTQLVVFWVYSCIKATLSFYNKLPYWRNCFIICGAISDSYLRGSGWTLNASS